MRILAQKIIEYWIKFKFALRIFVCVSYPGVSVTGEFKLLYEKKNGVLLLLFCNFSSFFVEFFFGPPSFILLFL